MKSIADLGDLRAAGADPLRPERAAGRRHDHRRRPDPGSLPTLNQLREAGAQGRRARPPGPAQGRGQPEVLARPRPPGGSVSCSGTEVKLADDVVGESAQEIVAGPGRRRGRDAGERPVRAGRGSQGRGRARARWPTVRRASATSSSPTASASCTASRPACTTWPAGCRTRRAGWSLAEVEVLQRLTEDPRAAVRRGARRRQGVGQAGRDRQPDRDRRHAGDRRRHGLHLPGGPGVRGGQEPARGGPDRHGQGVPRRPRPQRRQIVLPSDIVVAPEFKADAPPTVVPADAIPADQLGLDIGPESAKLFAAVISERARPCSGTARWASRSGRTSPAAPRPWPRR